jgi:DNA-directed RNA polymerase subunit L
MEKRRFEGRKLKIKIIEKSSNELKIELEGETLTFCDLLQKYLIEDENVEVAGCDLAHPLISNPTLYVHTKKGQEPVKALYKAVEKLRLANNSFRTSLEKTIEELNKQ